MTLRRRAVADYGGVDVMPARDRADGAVAAMSPRLPIPPPSSREGDDGDTDCDDDGGGEERIAGRTLPRSRRVVGAVTVAGGGDGESDDAVHQEGVAASGGSGGGGGDCVTACCFRLPTQRLSSAAAEREEGDDEDDADDDDGRSEWHASGDEHGSTTSGGIKTFEPDESFFGRSVECGESEVPGTLLPPPLRARTAPSRPDARRRRWRRTLVRAESSTRRPANSDEERTRCDRGGCSAVGWTFRRARRVSADLRRRNVPHI